MTVYVGNITLEYGDILFEVCSSFPAMAYYELYEYFVEIIAGEKIERKVLVQEDRIDFIIPDCVQRRYYNYIDGFKYELRVGAVDIFGNKLPADDVRVFVARKEDEVKRVDAKIVSIEIPEEVYEFEEVEMSVLVKNLSEERVSINILAYANREKIMDDYKYVEPSEVEKYTTKFRVSGEGRVEISVYAYIFGDLYDQKDVYINVVKKPEPPVGCTQLTEGDDFIQITLLDKNNNPVPNATIELFRCNVPDALGACSWYFPYGATGTVELGYELIETTVTNVNGFACFNGVNSDWNYAIAAKVDDEVIAQMRFTEPEDFNKLSTIKHGEGELPWPWYYWAAAGVGGLAILYLIFRKPAPVVVIKEEKT